MAAVSSVTSLPSWATRSLETTACTRLPARPARCVELRERSSRGGLRQLVLVGLRVIRCGTRTLIVGRDGRPRTVVCYVRGRFCVVFVPHSRRVVPKVLAAPSG